MDQKKARCCFILPAILVAFLFSAAYPAAGQVSKHDSLDADHSKNIRILVYENQKAALRWWNAWLVGYSAATVAQAGIAITSPKLTTRQDMWNGAATTFLGAAGVILTPLVPQKEEVEKMMAAENEPDRIFNDDDYYITCLKEISRREKFGRSWKVQAVTVAVNAGSGLVTWLGFKRNFSGGLITFAINSIVTEAQIWSEPIRAKKDYENYMRTCTKGRMASSNLPNKRWILSTFPGGASLRIQF